MAGFFEFQLIILAVLCVLAMLFERYGFKSGNDPKAKEDEEELHLDGLAHAGSSLGKSYLTVYTVVMGADWLQGPYVYSLYREQYNFSEHQVALLFVTGFIAAGFSGPFVGVWADQYGRKLLCSVFCVTYAASCILIQQPILPLLFAGRIMGGLSTAILFGVFESWLVAAFQALPATLALSATAPGVKMAVSRTLSRTMGRAALLNGIVAATAGVAANWVVTHTENNNKIPFVISGLLLGVAWVLIRKLWDENYGSPSVGGTVAVAGGEFTKLKQALGIVAREPAYLVLGLTQTCFEGSMYLFVFLWVPSLQEAGGSSLPLGYIFSAFMISMMLGSIAYTMISSTAKAPVNEQAPLPSPTSAQTNGNPPSRKSGDTVLILHAKLASIICGIAAFLFAYSSSSTTLPVERRFWAFCAFEACVGAYYPVMGMLRGTLVPNEVRATLSSLFRVPLNIFVTVALLTGVSSARHLVFAGCSVLLGVASIACALVLLPKGEVQPARNGEDVHLTG